MQIFLPGMSWFLWDFNSTYLLVFASDRIRVVRVLINKLYGCLRRVISWPESESLVGDSIAYNPVKTRLFEFGYKTVDFDTVSLP